MALASISQFDLLQHIPLGICTVNRDYSILSWNKPLQNWTSIAYRDIAGKNLMELYPHLDAPRYRSRFDLAFRGGAPYVFSPQLHPHFFPSTLPNGQERIQRTTVVSQTIAGDRRVLVICIQDVTNMMNQLQKINELQRTTLLEMEARKKVMQELENANEQLVEHNRDKDRIMQILSHDLRSPISGIKGAAELISSNPTDLATVTEFSSMIASVSDSLVELINEFLDLAKIRSGKITLNPDYFDIREIVQRAVEFMEVLASSKNIKLTSIVPSEVFTLSLDRSKLLQVFSNLLSNAIKFTPSGGSVTISVEREPSGEALVKVIDTGIGIPEKHLPMLFEQFGQHQRNGTAGEKGTGLGMPLVKSFVELHGGSIEVNSEAGKGTTFTLRLPALPDMPTYEFDFE